MQSAPLAPVGAQVRAGAAIGLLQIGALLLPVSAPQAAIVAGLRVAHGTLVGYGTPLIDLDAN
jgi:acetyl-CoA carboxylase biotin carboxyl carrier protein